MMKKNKNSIYKMLFAFMFLATAACSQNSSKADDAPKAPASWHQMPEDTKTQNFETAEEVAAAEEKIAPAIEDYISATGSALENVPEQDGVAAAHAQDGSLLRAGEKIPWHLEYFMTDISVAANGVVGHLFLKGTPAVTFNWRKQYPKSVSAPVRNLETETQVDRKSSDLSIDSTTSEVEIERQLEPAVRAAVASGQVQDRETLMRNLVGSAKDFQSLAQGMSETADLDWWVSRLRLDLTVDATGKVSPLINVGGDLRFRFEWHRIMKKTTAPAKPIATLPIQSTQLQQFVRAIAEDLTVLSDSQETTPSGFKAGSFRVGLGITAKGNVGVAKASAGLIGHVYFSRNVAKPVVNPKPKMPRVLSSLTEIEVIDADPTPARLEYAAVNQIPVQRDRNGGVVYSVQREKLREGLKKANKVAKFFGKHASTAAQGMWKVYEMKTGFDLSLSGKLALVEIGGLATTEISFFNQSF